MRFWLPSRVMPMGEPAFVCDDPERLAEYIVKKIPIQQAELRLPNIKDQSGGKLIIRGEYEANDPAVCKALMAVGGNLRCNPQDAVDEGIFTAGEVKAMGFDVFVPEDAEVTPPEVEELPVIRPDFDTINKGTLVEWADAQEPPIHLDRRMRKDDLVKIVRKELKKRGKE